MRCAHTEGRANKRSNPLLGSDGNEPTPEYRWIGIYGGTTADHHFSMRSERNYQGTSVLGQVGPYCAWFPSKRFPADFKGPKELENLKKSPDGQVPIWGVKTQK